MSEKTNRETIEELLEELNKESQYLEFAYGAELEDPNDDRKLKVITDIVEDLNKTVRKLGDQAKVQFEKLKNDESLKNSVDEALNKANEVLNDLKGKAGEAYQREDVQKAVSSAKEGVNKAFSKVADAYQSEEVQKRVESVKVMAGKAFVETGKVINTVAGSPLVKETAAKAKSMIAEATVSVCEAFAKWLRK